MPLRVSWRGCAAIAKAAENARNRNSELEVQKAKTLALEALDLCAGFVAGLCLIRARFSWALRDVSSERHP